MAYTIYKRPKIITMLVVFGFVGVLLNMPSVFSPDTRRLGDFYPALFGLLISLRFIAYVGVWHYKRWGVELFMVTFFANLIVELLLDLLNPVAMGTRAVILIVFAIYYRKMDKNL